MTEARDITTDEEIDRALEQARKLSEPVRVLSAEYSAVNDVIVLRLDSNRRLVLPREELQGLQNATPEQLSDMEIHAGLAISWPRLDVNHSLSSLLAGRYGNDRWMRALGRPFAA